MEITQLSIHLLHCYLLRSYFPSSWNLLSWSRTQNFEIAAKFLSQLMQKKPTKFMFWTHIQQIMQQLDFSLNQETIIQTKYFPLNPMHTNTHSNKWCRDKIQKKMSCNSVENPKDRGGGRFVWKIWETINVYCRQ